MKLYRLKFERNCGHEGVVWARRSESSEAINEHKKYRCGTCVLNDYTFIDDLKAITAYQGAFNETINHTPQA